MMKLSHEVLLALAYVSQISDPDSIRSRFIESLNALDESFAFEFADRLPPGVPEHRVLPIATLRSSFGYAVLADGPQTDAERAVFRSAFQFLAVLLENRLQARALESRNESLLKEIHEEKSLVRTVLDTLPVGVWVADGKGAILMGNAADEKIWAGIRHIGIDQYSEYKAWWSGTGKRIESEEWAVARALRKGEISVDEEIHIECFDGTHKTILSSAAPLLDDKGRVIGAVGVNQDITERKKADEALRESEQKYRNLFDNAVVGMYRSRIDGSAVLEVNQALCDVFECTRDEMLFEPATIRWARPEARREMVTQLNKVAALSNYEVDFVSKNGKIRNCLVSVKLYPHEGYLEGTTIDITERKRAEEEKQKLQDQLLQSQKMESVGRLAGGVAHDFNNMLGVILGHAEMALEQVDPAQPLHADLTEIRKAAERSSDLTRQLLAFARKQTVSPRVLDLNETVAGMLTMLQRLIGEDIHPAWLPGSNLWPVKVDPSQIDQILANLSVNARDAIADVGKFTIETQNVRFDEDDCPDHAGLVPGEYVLLTVSDDGCGMDKEILGKLFEPFFTTKGVGKGTGLGLATVYGIVKQNNGFINVYSEPDRGTTFRIYLPRHIGKAEQARTEGPQEPAQYGRETVLVVEDEQALLDLSRHMLEKLGYRVLAADTPREAIRLGGEHMGEIHLLMTDVVMPEMNGRDLAQKMLSLYPSLKCLFMSGYTANVIAHHGILDEDVHFIQKPFSRKELAAKIRDTLDHNLPVMTSFPHRLS